MGVSSGKIIPDGKGVSLGKVISFSAIRCQFLSLCGLFSRILALMRSKNFYACRFTLKFKYKNVQT